MGGSFGKKKSKIIIVGLDNSGKSTMINTLKPKKVSKESINMRNTIPNIFNWELQRHTKFGKIQRISVFNFLSMILICFLLFFLVCRS